MGSLFRDFLTNGSLFFDLFDQAAKNTVEMATLLVSVVNTEMEDDRAPIFKQIDKMENTGDDITHKIYLWLNKVIFPPLNRNDVHSLASSIDDVADAIQEASGRMYLYVIDDFVLPIKEIAAITLKASLQVQKTINLLRSAKEPDQMLELCRQIKSYERQSDQVYYHAVAELFSEEKDPIRLLKYREIFFSMETTVTKCKNVTDVLSAILVSR